MATTETNRPEETRVNINRDKPTTWLENSWITVRSDWKLPWLMTMGFSIAVVFAIASQTPDWWIGFPYAVFALTFYGTLIHIPWLERKQTSALTMLYRKWTHRLHNFTGYNWYLSLDPAVGEAFGLTDARRKPPRQIRALGKIRFLPHEVEIHSGSDIRRAVMGVIHDYRNHTMAGTLKVTYESLYSVEAGTRARRLAAFAHLLDTLTQGDIYRLAIQDTTLQGEYQDTAALLEAIQSAGHQKRSSSPNRDVLLRWVQDNNHDSVTHETTMTLSIHLPAVRREAKQLDGDYGRVMERVLRDIRASAISRGSGQSPLGLTSAPVLSYNDLVLLNLLRLDPVFAQPLWQRWSRPKDTDYLLDEKLAWPDSSDFRSVNICRLGESYHHGFYLEEFGEAGMMQDAFWEIQGVPVPKTVTVIFQMIPRPLARKETEHYATGAWDVKRQRIKESKRVFGAHEEAEREAFAIEDEIARNQGHVGKVRCYVDVTGSTPDEAHAHARTLRSVVETNTPFIIRPLTTRQLRGIDAVMPLARGLRL